MQNSWCGLITVKLKGREDGNIRRHASHETSCQGGGWKTRLSVCVPGRQTTVYVRGAGRTPTLTCTYRLKVTKVVSEGGASASSVCFSCFFLIHTSPFRSVLPRWKAAGLSLWLAPRERARETKTSELYKHHSRRRTARTTHRDGSEQAGLKTRLFDQAATR